MKGIQISGLYLLFLCCYLKGESNRSSYIDLNDSYYNVIRCVSELSTLDDDAHSPVNALKNYIQNGNVVSEQNEVVHVLEYARELLERRSVISDTIQCNKLVLFIDLLVNAIKQDLLMVDINDSKQNIRSHLMVEEDGVLDNSAVRLTLLNDNITIIDSTAQLIGNILKKDSTGRPGPFIQNMGKDNTFVGLRSGARLLAQAAQNNVGFGADTLRSNQAGFRNVAVGKNALQGITTGARSVAVGYSALGSDRGAIDSVAVGNQSLLNIQASLNNTAVGAFSLGTLSSGSDNVAIGYKAGFGATSGNRNVWIGPISAANGDDNICIGQSSSKGDHNVYIGYQLVDSGVESFTTRIGVLDTGFQPAFPTQSCFIAGINNASVSGSSVFVDTNGQLVTMPSTRRVKDSIQEISDESQCIYDLSPVSFIYKNDELATKHYGLIAEEVDEQFPCLVVKNNSDAPYSVRYDMLPVLLLNELKKQKQHLSKQEEDLQEQKNDYENLQSIVNDLQQKIQSFSAE